MKLADTELEKKCRAICKKYGVKYDSTPVRPSPTPSKKTIRANEEIARYGLPKEFYERIKERS